MLKRRPAPKPPLKCSVAAERQRRYRQRRKRGAVLVQIELSEDAVAELQMLGFLSLNAADDPLAIKAAFDRFLERAFHGVVEELRVSPCALRVTPCVAKMMFTEFPTRKIDAITCEVTAELQFQLDVTCASGSRWTDPSAYEDGAASWMNSIEAQRRHYHNVPRHHSL